MGTITKISITRELEKIKRNNLSKKNFLYPIFFKEDFYGIAYNRFVDDRKFGRNRVYEFKNNLSFLTLKRLIKKLRQSNYSWIHSDKLNDKFQIVQEILIIVFNSIFTSESKLISINTNEWNSNQSIHSIFPFMEDKFNNSTICLDSTIPYSFHPETLIRLSRKNVSDTSFLHFLRLLLHKKKYIDLSLPEFCFRKNQFYNLLWNFQLQFFEYSLINIWKQFYHLPSSLLWFLINRTSFLQKRRYISENLDSESTNNMIQKSYSIHYARYRNTLVVGTNGNLPIFVKNWNFFLFVFWEKYFHSWFEPYRVDIKNLSKNPIYFLGYLLHLKGKRRLIQIQLVHFSIDTNWITKEFCTIVPIVSLIRLLAKEKFCNSSGRPICRVSWTTLTDHEIFKRFDQIIRNIFFYYSGSIEKKGLYQLHYILRFSCAKTLACKHKSTIRTVWKKYGSNFVENSVYLKKPQLISWRTYEKKYWYLNIIQINFLAHFPQKLRNVREL
jgi:maturase K